MYSLLCSEQFLIFIRVTQHSLCESKIWKPLWRQLQLLWFFSRIHSRCIHSHSHSGDSIEAVQISATLFTHDAQLCISCTIEFHNDKRVWDLPHGICDHNQSSQDVPISQRNVCTTKTHRFNVSRIGCLSSSGCKLIGNINVVAVTLSRW